MSIALIGTALAAAQPVLAQGNKCTEEAASIRRAEGQLPRLEVAPPGDRQIVCITLETNMLFARRLAAHLKHCPHSPLARAGDQGSVPIQVSRGNFATAAARIRSYRG